MVEKIELCEVKKEETRLVFSLKDSRGFMVRSVLGDKLKEIERLTKEFGMPSGINLFYAFKYGKGKICVIFSQQGRQWMDSV